METSSSSSVGESSPPRRIFSVPNYDIQELLAVGGVAEIWLAQRKQTSEFVALKRLRDKYDGSAEHLRRLKREARIGMLVRHPNVVRTLDAGEQGGGFYIATEYVAGVDLEKLSHTLVRLRRPFPSSLAVRIILEVLTGLQAIHATTDAKGRPLHIVHRDLSPRNVQLGFDGSVVLIDFGVAFAAFDDLYTEPGSVLGTLRYMAPEQAMGEPPTAPVDLFAIGTILWELLTGQWLFNEPSKEAILKAVSTAQVPPPTSVNPHLPQALDAVLSRALAHAPSERFPTALAMKNALEAAVPEWTDMPVEAVGGFAAQVFPEQATAHKQREAQARRRAPLQSDALGARPTEAELSEQQHSVRRLMVLSTQAQALSPKPLTQTSRPVVSPDALDFPPEDRAILGTDYDLVRKLGEGGMGRVYLVQRAGAEALSVVKVLNAQRKTKDAPRQLARFRREVSIQTRCKHPSIPKVLSAHIDGAHADTPFMEMEYVAGCDMDGLRDPSTRAVPPSILIPMAIDYLDALHHAHELKSPEGHLPSLVHRDISPQNLMVTFQGDAKLIDFGVAHEKTDMALTRADEFVGKVMYCSPEQVFGTPLDRRSDVYSFGVALLELLTGTPWLSEATDRLDILRAVAQKEVPLLSEHSDVPFPPALEAVLRTATQKEPEDRFATAAAMKLALERATTSLSSATQLQIAQYVQRSAPDRYEDFVRLKDWFRPEETPFHELTDAGMARSRGRRSLFSLGTAPVAKWFRPLLLVLFGAVAGATALLGVLLALGLVGPRPPLPPAAKSSSEAPELGSASAPKPVSASPKPVSASPRPVSAPPRPVSAPPRPKKSAALTGSSPAPNQAPQKTRSSAPSRKRPREAQAGRSAPKPTQRDQPRPCERPTQEAAMAALQAAAAQLEPQLRSRMRRCIGALDLVSDNDAEWFRGCRRCQRTIPAP